MSKDNDPNLIRNWLAGIASAIIISGILGNIGMFFTLNERQAVFEANQGHVLNEVQDLKNKMDRMTLDNHKEFGSMRDRMSRLEAKK